MNGQVLTETLYYILLSVVTPSYGYRIMENVETLTNGRLKIGAGTLYGAINTLLKKGYIELYSQQLDSRKKKEYIITEQGKEILKEEIYRLEEMVKNGRGVFYD